MDASKATLEDLIARLFIARPDVKAYQAGPGPYVGQYFTDIEGDRNATNPRYRGWSRAAIQDHLSGATTYGHYLLSKENTAKLFAFDIDIKAEASLPGYPMPGVDDPSMLNAWQSSFSSRNGRAAWLNRADPARDYIKLSMRTLAHVLERVIEDELQVPTAVAYTGCKGLHVYGFTGPMPAVEVREAAMLVVEALPIKPVRGKMIYEWDSSINGEHPAHEMFSIEVFPKQDEISKEGGFGNLMRLPLGKNQKSKDPTFFVNTDLGEVPMGDLKPIDPVAKLRSVLERVA